MIRILHITNWYPSKSEPYKVPFIKEHFEALNLYTEGYLVHVEIQRDKSKFCEFSHHIISDKEESFVIKTRFYRWFLVEWMSYFLLKFVLKKMKFRGFDIINFHTAYPLLARRNKFLSKIPHLIIEHWTAFHYNFNLPSSTNKLNRIKNIYGRGVPLITVSKRLSDDIELFSGHRQHSFVVPNVVPNDFFYYDDQIERIPNQFFMVNYWRDIKSPFPIFEAFKEYSKHNSEAILRVGGYGPLWAGMEEYVAENNLKNRVVLLGRLSKQEIGNEMRKASLFLHNAEYETFSVVCAEAISCGCPVLINYLDAVAEFIDESNGYLKPNDLSWTDAINKVVRTTFDYKKISQNATALFNAKTVGERYFHVNKEVIKKYKW